MRDGTPEEYVVRDHRFLTKNFIVYLSLDKEPTIRLTMGEPAKHQMTTLKQSCFTGEVITKSGDRFHAVIGLGEQGSAPLTLGVVGPDANGRMRFLLESDPEFQGWIRFMQQKHRGFAWQPYAYCLYVGPHMAKTEPPTWSKTWAELQQSEGKAV